ncbi:fumarylacetoacetase [Variovorax sp. WS11]|uniref:fumarylacetoacetase n=1 Tax=Variovorax sp. WS11 TaxID=1105204 RepID=UPI000D0CD2CF|nr:fumarylacetoacetase [Variovorax sp. WS11]NDZ17609.1 fumarylacetoacetase [Variovorax sp. WS11]PSL82188.1 fumarylacetoacetase [Variovorax sp. WS11]
MNSLNRTHDPGARSWVAAANEPLCDFPIQNLPYGVFRTSSQEPFHAGVAIGDSVLDLGRLHASGLLDGLALQAASACLDATLNRFMAMGAPAWQALRHAAFDLLNANAAPETVDAARKCLVLQTAVEHAVPVAIGDYTDYFTSIHHAINGGLLLDPAYKLARAFQWLPMAYHGRASSIGMTGHQFPRPHGQVLDETTGTPVYRPTRRLDFELELGVFVGRENALGEPVGITEAEDSVFGICLLNDWSARDIQAWEMTPLGPFQAKNFASTLSPWIVTLEALAPFRSAVERVLDGPAVLPYLDSPANRERGAFDIRLKVSVETAAMRASGSDPRVLCTTNFAHQYWTVAQMLTHHTAGGCNLRVGDLLGTGTISDPQPENAGSLIELSQAGRKPLDLGNGEERSFVEDGDKIILQGWCERGDFRRIGFGSNFATVTPARQI